MPKGGSPRICASACSGTQAMEKTHSIVFEEGGSRGHDERKEGTTPGKSTTRPHGIVRGLGVGSLSQMGSITDGGVWCSRDHDIKHDFLAS